MNLADLKEFINYLAKAKKNLRLYPENNPVYQKTVEDIYQRLLNLLEDKDAIVFRFSLYDIYSEGERLYHNEDKYESLAMFFFKDGLRELKFLKGIPRDEFGDFLKVISTDFDREALDDDLVTLMWEKDFQYIHYTVDEALLLEDSGPYDEKEIERVKGITTDEGIFEAYKDAFETVSSETPTTIMPLTNEDVRTIVEELDRAEEDIFNRFINLIFEMFYMVDNPTDANYLQGVLKKTLDMAMDRARVDVVVDTYKRIVSALEAKEYPREVVVNLMNVLSHINSEDFIEIFGRPLQEGIEYKEEEIEAISYVFDKRAIGPLLELLAKLDSRTGRRIIIRLLVLIGRKNTEALIQKLSDPRWYLVRNILYILREIDDRRTAQNIAPLIRHKDKRVRRLAIEIIGRFEYNNALPLLRDALEDEEESVRIAVVRSLARIHTPAAKRLILGQIKDRSFYKKSIEEKKEFFKALASWDDKEVKDFVLGILKKRGLLRKARLNQLKALAANTAGLMLLKEAERPLEKLTDAKDPYLREEAQEALKRLRYAKG